MYRVLLPVDENLDRAEKQANYITELPCASDQIEVVVAHTMTGEEREVPDAMQRVDRCQSVRRAKEMLEDAGVAVDTRELSSPPDEGILSFVQNSEVDEIVMGGRKRSATEKALLGSTTQTILLNVSIPVTATGG